MAIWYIANNLWSSSEEPVDLGLVNGVQTYRVQSLMSAYNNCVNNDELTLDPDSPNFKDARGNRFKTVVFDVNTNWTVNKSITLSGGKYRLRIDANGNDYGITIAATVKWYDVDFVRAVIPTSRGVLYVNSNRRLDCYRCLFAGIKGGHVIRFYESFGSFTDCAFVGNEALDLIGSDVTRNYGAVKYTRCVVSDRVSDSSNHVDRISLFNLTQEQVNAIGFIAPPKVLDPDNPGYYTDGTEWTKDDWENYDLHLHPDSPYATGNSLTSADGEVLDLDGVPRKPGGAKGAYEVAKSVVYFDTTGWGGTGALSWLGITKTLWGEYPTYLCSTVDQAINAAPNEGIVTPDPDSASFRDAAGFPLHTVVVNMGGALTINKQITLAGGAYRLRIDGGGGYSFAAQDVDLYDVDLVRMFLSHSSPIPFKGTCSATRCIFAGCSSGNTAYGTVVVGINSVLTLSDCAFIANWKNSDFNPFANAVTKSTRCTFFPPRSQTHNEIDCVSLYGLTNDDLSASFVKPPKVIDPDNPGYYTDGTAWTMNDWESVDLRLLSTSPYATGNALTSADGDVYDLAGNKRKPGGALGAYEVLDDVTHDSREQIPGWRYSVEKDADDAPDVVSAAVIENVIPSTYKRHTVVLSGEETVAYKINNEWVTKQKAAGVYDAGFNIPTEWRATNAAGSTTIRIFTTPENGDRECAATFKDNFFWYRANTTTTSSPTAASVVYVLHSGRFASTASTVAKVYVPGWTHADVGDVTAEVVLGLGATVKSSGKLTLVGETLTSEELFEKVKLVAPAEFTLKDCNVSD